jgi:hypothetical protein
VAIRRTHQRILGLVEWEAHNYAEFVVNALINETIKANA